MASPVYGLSDSNADKLGRLGPVTATMRGLVGYGTEMSDCSPEGQLCLVHGESGRGPERLLPAAEAEPAELVAQKSHIWAFCATR